VKRRFLYSWRGNYLVVVKLMAEKDLQWGLIGIVVSVFLLMGGLGMSMYTILDEHTSTFIAFILMAISIYLVAKK
jgi:hypothetical protein